MSFIYPRTVNVTRPATQTSVGIQNYSAVTKANETTVASGLPCSIQQVAQKGPPEGGTPSDAPTRTQWKIFIPKSSAENGLITERDICTDDLGKRYVVVAAYWNSLGYQLYTELLEA